MNILQAIDVVQAAVFSQPVKGAHPEAEKAYAIIIGELAALKLATLPAQVVTHAPQSIGTEFDDAIDAGLEPMLITMITMCAPHLRLSEMIMVANAIAKSPLTLATTLTPDFTLGAAATAKRIRDYSRQILTAGAA